MKKNLYSIMLIITILILTINIFIKSNQLTNIIVFSINLFIKNIFPSLFPMFILSSLLIEIQLPKIIGSIFKKPMNYLFKAPSSSSFVFFMSMITGSPNSAKILNDLIEQKEITNKEAEKILLFTYFANPLFVINTVGNNLFKNQNIGITIYVSHILSNIITGIIFRNYNKENSITINQYHLKDTIKAINNVDIFKELLISIEDSLKIMMNIFGIITFFLIIINVLINKPDHLVKILITGLFEMTSGLKYLSIMSLNKKIKIIISAFFISFGGLSIHLQIMNILKKRKIKYLPFLMSRIISAIINSLIIIVVA